MQLAGEEAEGSSRCELPAQDNTRRSDSVPALYGVLLTDPMDRKNENVAALLSMY